MGNNTGPLHGVRVMDLGGQQAGPRCPQVLARMGAEVIKIEALGGEESRYPRPWLRSRGSAGPCTTAEHRSNSIRRPA